MNSEQRKQASIDLTLTYLSSYYTDWRLAKILTIQKLVSERYTFFKSIIREVKQFDDNSGEATIAQEIKNGLYFDAIGECVQYIEDLFALIKASENPDYFIKNIVTYDAGRITNFIKSFRPSKTNIAKAFHYPGELELESQEHINMYEEGINNLISLVDSLVKFYSDYEFLYIQYKHGLAVAMRTFGNKFNEEQIENDKLESNEPYLAVYDNFNLTAASKKGRVKVKHGVFMSGFTKNVRPYISQLANENNFLRLVVPPDTPDFNIDFLIDNARRVKTCLNTFMFNYSRKIKPEVGKVEFQLPEDYKENKFLTCSYFIDNN